MHSRTPMLIELHVLGDVERWWNETGQYLPDGPTLDQAFLILRQVAGEAEASWSTLSEVSPAVRVYNVELSAIPMTLLIEERNTDLIVTDVRFPHTT